MSSKNNLAIRVSNLHKKVRFKDVLDMFRCFGSISLFYASEDAFFFKFETAQERALVMNGFPLAKKRMRVELIERKNDYDSFDIGNVVTFESESLDADEVRDECSMFGHVIEVTNSENLVHVICKSESDAETIFGNMYGRFYGGKRLRCKMHDSKNLFVERYSGINK